MAKIYRVDKKRVMTGGELLAFAKKRHRENNKGVHSPKNIGQAVWFLRLRGAYGKGGKGHIVEEKMESERNWF